MKNLSRKVKVGIIVGVMAVSPVFMIGMAVLMYAAGSGDRLEAPPAVQTVAESKPLLKKHPTKQDSTKFMAKATDYITDQENMMGDHYANQEDLESCIQYRNAISEVFDKSNITTIKQKNTLYDLDWKMSKLCREIYASVSEEAAMTEGNDAIIRSEGTRLTYTQASMTRPLSYKIFNDGSFMDDAKQMGFSQVEFFDNNGHYWSYDVE